MGRTDGERRSISTVVGTIMVLAIGVVVVYFGLGMVNVGLYALTRGEVLLGVVSLLFGTALVLGPVFVLVGQLRAMRHGRDRSS